MDSAGFPSRTFGDTNICKVGFGAPVKSMWFGAPPTAWNGMNKPSCAFGKMHLRILECSILSQSFWLPNMPFHSLPLQWFTFTVMKPKLREMSIHVVGTNDVTALEFPPSTLGEGMILTMVLWRHRNSHNCVLHVKGQSKSTNFTVWKILGTQSCLISVYCQSTYEDFDLAPCC